VFSAYVKKTVTSQINNVMVHIKFLRKQEQTKPKTSTQRNNKRSGPRSMRLRPKNTIQRINETKSWFFEKIIKIDKPLTKMTKQRREKTQINKIRAVKGDITTNTTKIQRIIREYFGNSYIK
jgi:hypothetical protein